MTRPLCKVCNRSMKSSSGGRPRVVHNDCRGKYETERRRVRRVRRAAAELVTEAAEILGDDSIQVRRLLTRACRLLEDSPIVLGAAARRRWFSEFHPEVPLPPLSEFSGAEYDDEASWAAAI